jgi:hypothetical protein
MSERSEAWAAIEVRWYRNRFYPIQEATDEFLLPEFSWGSAQHADLRKFERVCAEIEAIVLSKPAIDRHYLHRRRVRFLSRDLI